MDELREAFLDPRKKSWTIRDWRKSNPPSECSVAPIKKKWKGKKPSKKPGVIVSPEPTAKGTGTKPDAKGKVGQLPCAKCGKMFPSEELWADERLQPTCRACTLLALMAWDASQGKPRDTVAKVPRRQGLRSQGPAAVTAPGLTPSPPPPPPPPSPWAPPPPPPSLSAGTPTKVPAASGSSGSLVSPSSSSASRRCCRCQKGE